MSVCKINVRLCQYVKFILGGGGEAQTPVTHHFSLFFTTLSFHSLISIELRIPTMLSIFQNIFKFIIWSTAKLKDKKLKRLDFFLLL